jgi:hypothetical protein
MAACRSAVHFFDQAEIVVEEEFIQDQDGIFITLRVNFDTKTPSDTPASASDASTSIPTSGPTSDTVYRPPNRVDPKLTATIQNWLWWSAKSLAPENVMVHVVGRSVVDQSLFAITTESVIMVRDHDEPSSAGAGVGMEWDDDWIEFGNQFSSLALTEDPTGHDPNTCNE